MPDTTAGRQDLQRIEAALAGRTTRGATIRGPVRLLTSTPGETGTRYTVTLSALLPVDPDDPALAGISIPLPVEASAEVRGDGAVADASVMPLHPAAVREARAFARGLIANGAVRGLAPSGAAGPALGPAVRPTHEIATEPGGEKVIRRVGFAAAG